MDQLHMHFTQAIHNTVFQVVLGYVELCAGNADTKFQKMQYKDLCTVSTHTKKERLCVCVVCASWIYSTEHSSVRLADSCTAEQLYSETLSGMVLRLSVAFYVS